MKVPVEVRCIECPLVFCCADCRRAHERFVHNLLYECPICRYEKFVCSVDNLSNVELIDHLVKEHMPLHCSKCERIFSESSHFENIDICKTNVKHDEILCVNNNNEEVLNNNDMDEDNDENEVTNNIINEEKEIEDRFNSLYEKCFDSNKGSNNNFEAIVSINKSNKTAVITPILKHVFQSDSIQDEQDDEGMCTPHPKKEQKLRRTYTPHVKKLLTRQEARDQSDENDENEISESDAQEKCEFSGMQLLQHTNTSRTPSRVIEADENEEEVHTPTSHMLKVDMCAALASAVTTSTPTHPASQWNLFPEPGTDSPLSEIEGTGDSPMESPQGEVDTESSNQSNKKLKSIIITNGKPRFGSQDSSEKQVTFAETVSSDTSSKIKKVKFAEDTKFEDNKEKRVFRRPKRLLTPGPQCRTRKITNPHFQALLNRFETHQTISRTPDNCRDENDTETTPAFSDVQIIPARAINFKEDSPTIEENTLAKPSPSPATPSEEFKSCIASPSEINNLERNAIDDFANNIASSIQSCLSNALQTTDDATEIQFKFVVTKKRVSVRRLLDGENPTDEKDNNFERQSDRYEDNIWRTIAKVVKNVFWSRSDERENYVTTPTLFSNTHVNLEPSSGAKRKSDDILEPDVSPIRKRYKYGRIRGRRPLPRVLRQEALALKQSGSKSSEGNTDG